MKRIALASFAALALSACATTALPSIPPAPVVFADKTILDEQALTGLELGYKGARIACELAVDLGRIKGANATRFRALNRQAYDVLVRARAAYDSGNASSYQGALDQAKPLINELLALTGKA